MSFKSCAAWLLALCTVALSATQVRATRRSAVYQVGEPVEFKIIDPAENMTYTLLDGSEVITQDRPIKPGETITYTATKPGFLLVRLDAGESNDQGKKIIRQGGAAVEPEKILPGSECPADFNAFWDDELKKMRANPLEIVRETPIPAEIMKARPGFDGYEVEVKRGDITVTGFLIVPQKAKPKSLPAILTFNGASQVNAHFPMACTEARRSNAISFNTNFHALPNLAIRDRKAEASLRKQVARYQYKFADDPQNYAMRKIFLRTALAADYIMQRPEYDGERLAAMGSSLGGCQALVCAALVPEVKYCVSNATAMCNHFGGTQLPGWPMLLANVPEAKNTAPYFDLCNFARRVKCKTEMSVGFIDKTVPPASTYAAYNMLSTKDKMMNHTVSGDHGPAWEKGDTPVFNHGAKNIRDFFKSYKKQDGDK